MRRSIDAVKAGEAVSGTRATLLQWFGVLGGPTAWATSLTAAYGMVPGACGMSTTVLLQVVCAVALAASLSAAFVSWRILVRAGGVARLDAQDPMSRSRFMAATGALSGLLFSLAIAAQWLTILVLHPCMGI
jgi:hypothetical protein